MPDQHDEIQQQSRMLAHRMRSKHQTIVAGTGVKNIIGYEENPTHYMDCMYYLSLALEQFKKDYSAYDRGRREKEKEKKQALLDQKKLEYLERENQKWKRAQSEYQKNKQKSDFSLEQQKLGLKRTPNSNW